MTRKEASKIVAVITSQYPQFYKGMKDDDTDGIISTWAELFQEDDYSVVSAALRAYLASDTTGYPPAIGQIKEKIRMMTKKPQMSETEAWDLVRKAIMKSDKRKSFSELPELIQRCVGSPTILRDWGLVDIEQFNTVIASNFMRVYRTKSQEKAEYEKIPASVRRALPQIDGLFLIDGE